MSTISINNALILNEMTGGRAVTKATVNSSYGPHATFTAARTALEGVFDGTLNNVPQGYTICILNGPSSTPVEYWFPENGNASLTLEEQVVPKQSQVDMSSLGFRVITQGGQDILQYTTDINASPVVWRDTGLTITTSSSDINNIKIRNCEIEGSNYGQLQISYDNGVTWDNKGARDDSRLKPLNNLQLSVNDEGQLQVHYGDATELPTPVVGAIFGNEQGVGREFHILDYASAKTIQYEGHTYTGQSAVNAMVTAATDFPIQFNIWMNELYTGLPVGTRVLFVSTLVDRIGGTAYTDVADGPGYVGYPNRLNNGTGYVIAQTLDSVLNNYETYYSTHSASGEKSEYYFYQSVKISSTMWTGLVWVGKVYQKFYNRVPFNIEISCGTDKNSYEVSATYRWDHDNDGESFSPEHLNITQGVSFDVASAVPFILHRPTTLTDNGDLFFTVKEGGVPVNAAQTFSAGTHHFTISLPNNYNTQEYSFLDGTSSGYLNKPQYDGVVYITGTDNKATYYGSVTLHYCPYIKPIAPGSDETNEIFIYVYVRDRYTNSFIPNARVYQDGHLIGITDSSANPINVTTAKNVSVQYSARAEGYAESSSSDGGAASGNATLYLDPALQNARKLHLNITPKTNMSVWIDGVKQLEANGNNPEDGVLYNGILERWISIGNHTLYITALNHRPYGPEVIEVTESGYTQNIDLVNLGTLYYNVVVESSPTNIDRSGGTGNLEVAVFDNFESPCTILKIVPDAYDDFTVNSLVEDPVTHLYTANITFASYAHSSASTYGSGIVSAYVYYRGTDGTTVDSSQNKVRRQLVHMRPYTNEE